MVVSAEMRPEHIGKPLALDETTPRQRDIEIRQHIPPGKFADPALEGVKPPRGVERTDNRTDGRTAHHVRLDSGLSKRPKHADMSPATGRSTTQSQADSWLFR